jgi:hypothetical protein
MPHHGPERLLTFAQAADEGRNLPRGSLLLMTTDHDYDCPLRGGLRYCTCDPQCVWVTTIRTGEPTQEAA